MKTPLKIAGWLLLAVVVVAITAATYVSFLLPNVGDAPELKVDVTPERIQRGEYLANHVVICMDCHSQRDFSKFSGPLAEGTLGMGGEKFAEEFGFPGTFYAKNITPHGLSDWTDGELYRTITTGVTKDGKAIFPVMPYKYYGQMDPEDVKDIIAYLRSIDPIESTIPESKANFPFNFILNTIPSKAEPVQKPSPSDPVAYGRYLTNIAGCVECHTPPDDKGQKLPGMELAGGWEMGVGGGKIVTTANITPDKETGIGNWTESDFVNRFKTYADSGYVIPAVSPGEFQTIMPWTMYANMKEEDLKAIYAYLQSVPAVKNQVTKFK
jgi:mono/diheme cytochrome c family protein